LIIGDIIGDIFGNVTNCGIIPAPTPALAAVTVEDHIKIVLIGLVFDFNTCLVTAVLNTFQSGGKALHVI